MKGINMCDCCKDIWNRENLIKFDFTNNHKLFICPDCLKEMTNGNMIKAMFPNYESRYDTEYEIITGHLDKLIDTILI